MGVAVEVPIRRSRRRATPLWVLAVMLPWWWTATVEAGKDGPRWVKERVVFGDRLSEIAERHGVRVSSIVRWNKLDKKRPRIRAGRHLRIQTQLDPPPRQKVLYRVKRGDSWAKIAAAHGVDRKHLRKRWNRKKKRFLRAGDIIVVWAAKAPAPEAAGPPPPATALPIVSVPTTSMSVGRPNRGRLSGGLKLPKNPELYSVRNPVQSYGSSHTIIQLQTAIARFRRDSGFTGELVIKDISRRRGGRFRPHRSHRSGRDADIRLPLARGLVNGTVPTTARQVDWKAAWALLKALIDTGQIRYIFLSRNRQRYLHRAAEAAGVPIAELASLIEYPNRGGPALIRHARGHTTHFHVRFKCAEWEKRCRD